MKRVILTAEQWSDEYSKIIDKCKRAVLEELHEVEQVLGKALRYPLYPIDWDTEDVCVGANTVVSLAVEAAGKIRKLERGIEEAKKIIIHVANYEPQYSRFNRRALGWLYELNLPERNNG